MIDRKFFYDSIRESLFYGVLSQRQVNGMNYLLDVWERLFPALPIEWLVENGQVIQEPLTPIESTIEGLSQAQAVRTLVKQLSRNR